MQIYIKGKSRKGIDRIILMLKKIKELRKKLVELGKCDKRKTNYWI